MNLVMLFTYLQYKNKKDLLARGWWLTSKLTSTALAVEEATNVRSAIHRRTVCPILISLNIEAILYFIRTPARDTGYTRPGEIPDQ